MAPLDISSDKAEAAYAQTTHVGDLTTIAVKRLSNPRQTS